MSPLAFVAWIDSDEVLSTVSVSLMAPGSMTSSAMGVSLSVESKIVSETASFRAPAALAMRSVVVVSVSVGAERSSSTSTTERLAMVPVRIKVLSWS